MDFIYATIQHIELFQDGSPMDVNNLQEQMVINKVYQFNGVLYSIDASVSLHEHLIAGKYQSKL